MINPRTVIILTIKQLKRRVVQGLAEPELFYMPFGKKEKTCEYIYLSFRELQYSNYDEMLSEYPEYMNDILKLNKYKNVISYDGSEAILYTNDYKPICKLFISSTNIILKNIPYGTYRIRIIKGRGCTLQEYIIVVDENSNKKTFTLGLRQSYILIEVGFEDSENTADIYGESIYEEENMSWESPWFTDHILSCESYGRTFYKYYTYDGKYLGKVIRGFSTYQTGLGGGEYCYFKYYPAYMYSQHITGNYGFSRWDYLATNISRPIDYSVADIGIANSINMPIIKKHNDTRLITDISYVPNRPIVPERSDTGIGEVRHDSNYFYDGNEVYLPNKNNPSELQLVGYRLYFDDGMTSQIYSEINNYQLNPNSDRLPYDLIINSSDNQIYSHRGNHRNYMACNEVNENTIAYYNNYPNYSEDYHNYDSFENYDREYTFKGR